MSWKKVKLGSILTESKVISENPDTNKRIKVRLKVLGVEKRGIENEVEGATKQFIRRAGQFIFGKQNFHKGAFGIVPDELDGFESSSDLPAFDIEKSCLPEFLFYFFKQGNYYLELSKIAYGVATQRINMKEFFELEIPLPDIEIQKQIINQFKKLENGGLEISFELTHQLDLIKQLRQAFLREAMQGRFEFPQQPLTEALEGNGMQTGQQLLSKIKAKKAQLIAEKKLKKEIELAPISEDEIPFEIPEHWAWCRLGEICIMNYGKGLTKAECFDNGNYPVFGSNGIVGYYDIFLTEKKSIIIGRKGSAGALNISSQPSWTTDVAYYIEENDNLNFSFLNFLLKSLKLEEIGKGIKPGLNRNEAYNLIIGLPPLHEQEQIAAKLEELMVFCDGLEKSIKESQGCNEMLLQQVLREALQGEVIAV